MGSCRVVNYVNYFADWNRANGNPYTICSIDPFSWNWDINEQRTDYETIIKEMESHTVLLEMLGKCSIFIHEYYANAGMFNCDREGINNIYKFGMAAPVDICLPNWNDVFILFQDIINFDVNIRQKAAQDYNVIGKLSDQTKMDVFTAGGNGLRKFFNVCALSSFPEMEEWFARNFKKTRLFWTYNHVTKAFTLALFRMMSDKYFDGKLTAEDHDDMFANNYTSLTEYDTTFEWGEERIKLKV